jgi:hypothetical protein
LRSKNLFDKNAVTTGYYVSESNGNLYANASYAASEFIPIQASTDYVWKVSGHTAFYDSDKVYISGTTTLQATSPATAAFIRLSVPTASLDTEQLELGTVSTFYERYGLKHSSLKVTNNNFTESEISSSQIIPKSINDDSLALIGTGKNLFDKSAVTDGYYVYYLDGKLHVNATYAASDWIPVQPNTNYSLFYKHQLAFYDADKNYISGDNTSDHTITTPANCYYMRVTTALSYKNLQRIFQGDFVAAFKKYSKYFDEFSANVPFAINYLTETALDLIRKEITGYGKLAVPPKIYTVTTKEMSIYWDGIVAQSPNDHNYCRLETVSDYLGYVKNNYPGFGGNYNRYFRWTPTSVVTKSNLKVTLYNKYFQVIDQKDTEIIVSDITVSTATTLLGIGDSFTQGHNYLNHLQDILSGLTSEGMRKNGLYKCEGRGGWTISNYLTLYKDETNGIFSPFLHPSDYTYYGSTQFWNKVINQPTLYETSGFQDKATEIGFDSTTGRLSAPSENDVMYDDVSGGTDFIVWDGSAWATISEATLGSFSLDFTKYASAWNITTPDIVTILLGINSFQGATPELFDILIDDWLANMDSFIAAIKAWNPTVKIAVLIPPAGANQDGFYAHSRLSEEYKLTMWKLADAMIEHWKNEEVNNIYISDIYASVDRIYGIEKLTGQKPFDLYTGSETITYDNNTVHFNTDGDNQMGERLAGLIQYLR